ncbi:hypothetical protein BA190_26900 [Labrys sp. WJW]|uniref:hypothetical protein n=1 Tax=Labrys sp. WJW TaxID=1737983 RepID=UPI0008365019|nr:hypothetical protein [Labrys sp. WJW]OCC01844.1 hypothetical protein BA190_26900 [Labrys sp. WJW]
MANRFTSPVRVSEFDPKAQPVGPLASVPRQTEGSQTTSTVAGISAKLADKFSRLADQAAQVEGQRAGLAAGADPNFRPSGSMSIRGRAFDDAAVNVYSSNLTAKLGSDMADAFEANRDNPAGFAAAAEKIRQTYQKDHVFPEVAADFNHRWSGLQLAYRTKVGDNFKEKTNNEATANLVSDLDRSQTSRAQIIAAGGANAAEQTDLSIADDTARINDMVKRYGMNPVVAQKLLIGIRHDNASALMVANASKLKTPEEVDAFSEKLKSDFGAGKIKDLDGDAYDKLQGQLGRLATSMRTGQHTKANDLEKKFDDVLDRAGKGQAPTQAEMTGLALEAGTLGDAGMAMLAKAQRRLLGSQAIALAPTVGAAQSWLRDREAGQRAGVGGIIREAAAQLGTTPEDLATVISYETIGSFNPSKWGGKGGNYMGLIQFGPSERKQFGAYEGQSFRDQMGAVVRYLKARGFQPGMDIYDLYSTINAGQPGRYNASDGNGTVRGHVQRMLTSHRARALAVLGGGGDVVTEAGVSAGGMTKDQADDNIFFQKVIDARRTAEGSDPLGAAVNLGLTPSIAPIDFASPQFAGQIGPRVAQAKAIGLAQGRSPTFFTPDESTQIKAIVNRGGQESIDFMKSIVTGAGADAPAVLKEVGNGAPEMAFATSVSVAAGSDRFAANVANAIKARNEPGADKLPTIKADDAKASTDAALGGALAGLSDTAQQNLLHSVDLWYQSEARTRRVDPSTDPDKSRALYEEGLQEASGRTVVNGVSYGGLQKFEGSAWHGRAGGVVVVKPNVRADKFVDLLNSIGDEDLKSLPDAMRPVGANGKPMPIADLIDRALPVLTASGDYAFSLTDPALGRFAPVRTASGAPFVLPWRQLEGVLRERMPEAFR